ncbi:hypothetical protein MN0502_07050 [Arthrobacter sp. MN05-02]|nr:hypothetical protein MN0502_07050 [Arthrobacter sp. MN05-02]
MADEQVAQPELFLEVREEVEDLRLDRDVEGGHGLVEQQDTGLEREGTGDRHALALAAREGERPPLEEVERQAYLAEEFGRAVPPFARRPDGTGVQGIRENPADAEPGIEGTQRILVDELDVGPVRAAEILRNGSRAGRAASAAAGSGCPPNGRPRWDPPLRVGR